MVLRFDSKPNICNPFSPPVRYALAVLAVVLATVMSWSIPVIGQRMMFLFFLFAIFEIALWLGMRRAVVATVLSLAAFNLLFMLPLWHSAPYQTFALNAGFCVLAVLVALSAHWHRRATRTLRKGKKYLSRAQAVAQTGSWLLDEPHHELYWSDEIYRLFGISKDVPFSYEMLIAAVHAEDRDRVERSWQAARQGETYDIEYRIVAAGDIKWVRARAEAERGVDGALLESFGTIQDVTERKQAEEKLHASEMRFKLLADLSARLLASENPQDVVEELCRSVMQHLRCDCFCNYLCDANSKLLHLNASVGIAAENIGGNQGLDYAAEVAEKVARKGMNIVVEDIRHCVAPNAAPAIASGIQAYACLPLLAQGRVLGTLAFGTRERTAFSSEDLQLMSTVADQVAIAIQRIIDKQQLALSQKRLSSIVESAMDAIVTVDAKHRIMMFNTAAEKMLGCSAEEALGSSFMRFIPERFRKTQTKDDCIFGQAGVNKRCIGESGNVMGLRADGQEFPIEASVSRTEVEGQQLCTLMLRDITERVRAEEIKRERLELQERLARVAATVPGAICTFRQRPDGSLCMPFASEVFEELYGLPPDEVAEDIGPLFAQIAAEKTRQNNKTIADCAHAMVPWHDTILYHHPQKGYIWIEGHFVPVRETDGGILWHGYVQDVTERKQAQEDLRDSYDELARFNRAAVGRELRLIELKKEVNALCLQLGCLPRYPLDFENETAPPLLKRTV
ncbi:MAG: PAS domain S-box protein [Gammaproteobacteria bacterium]